MKNQNFALDEARIADILRKEILQDTQSKIQNLPKEKDLSNFECISTNKEANISPIMKMNEDEILAFVETFDVNQLATLTVAELNYIGEVLGVEPEILFGMTD